LAWLGWARDSFAGAGGGAGGIGTGSNLAQI